MVGTIREDIHRLFQYISALHEVDPPRQDWTMSMSSQDISVAYFDFDWNHLYLTFEEFSSKVERLEKEQATPHASLLTLVMPLHVIKDLHQLQVNLEAHAEAVLRGRTNTKEREHIRLISGR